MEMNGKVALVTGASRGIGAATARLLAERGAAVAIADLREEEGRKLADKLGDKAMFVRLDVTQETDWQSALETIAEKFGPVGILVNNAGIFTPRPIEDTSAEFFEQMYRVNQLGPFLGMRAVIPGMRKLGGGAIVNLSSVAGLIGAQGTIAYAATKWAVRGMSKVAAVELGKDGIRSVSVHPGVIDTPMNEEAVGREGIDAMSVHNAFRRAGSDIEVAELIAFLASDAASFITGGEYTVDGGSSAGR